jgi:hypothetical protein
MMGMPAGTPVQVRLASEELTALDNYRREKANPPSRAQVARELIRRGLNQHLNDPETRAVA